MEVPFPLPPRRLSADLNGWTLEGLDAAGRPGAQVRLVRVATTADAEPVPLSQGALAPLLRVERTLRIALDWRVETRVLRLSPAEFPVSLPVPLLAGESVQTAGVPVQDGQVLVNLAPGETQTAWTSTLEPARDPAPDRRHRAAAHRVLGARPQPALAPGLDRAGTDQPGRGVRPLATHLASTAG